MLEEVQYLQLQLVHAFRCGLVNSSRAFVFTSEHMQMQEQCSAEANRGIWSRCIFSNVFLKALDLQSASRGRFVAHAVSKQESLQRGIECGVRHK